MACKGEKRVHRDHLWSRSSQDRVCFRCGWRPPKDCKHENADHLFPGDLWESYVEELPTERIRVEQFRCCDCAAWLSLGPSNDHIPADEFIVAVAIAAGLRGHP